MLWLTWRQFRVQAAAVAALVAAFGVVLLVTGLRLASLYHASSFAACHRDCGQAAGNFLSQVGSGAATTGSTRSARPWSTCCPR